jgi:hypothetical protein
VKSGRTRSDAVILHRMEHTLLGKTCKSNMQQDHLATTCNQAKVRPWPAACLCPAEKLYKWYGGSGGDIEDMCGLYHCRTQSSVVVRDLLHCREVAATRA